MKTIELLLPSHLLPALFNGDMSGIEDTELETFEAWSADRVEQHGMFHAIDFEDAGFCHRNDYERLAGDCHLVTFDVNRIR